MKTIIASFVRKVLAVHPEDHLSKQEIAFTLIAFLFMIIFMSILVRSLIILGF